MCLETFWEENMRFLTLITEHGFCDRNRQGRLPENHKHKRMVYKEVRGRLMWLTPAFGDRVRHSDRLLNVAKCASLCLQFVKWRMAPPKTGHWAWGCRTNNCRNCGYSACDSIGIAELSNVESYAESHCFFNKIVICHVQKTSLQMHQRVETQLSRWIIASTNSNRDLCTRK